MTNDGIYRAPGTRSPEAEAAQAAPFSGEHPSCAKCSSKLGTLDRYDESKDKLLRACLKCRFTWFERTADSSR